MDTLKLPFQFDVALLRKDLDQISQDLWLDHFNKQDYQGAWSVVALRSVGGHEKIIYSVPASPDHYKDTPILSGCSYFQYVMQTIACGKQAVRLMNLFAGSQIKNHTDEGLSFEEGTVRIHIPITTNPDVEFYLNNNRIIMNPGECWYLDFTKPHRIDNKGTCDRTHLVLDCPVDNWLKNLFDELGYQPSEENHPDYSEVKEEDIDQIVEQLRFMNTETSNKMADELEMRKAASAEGLRIE